MYTFDQDDQEKTTVSLGTQAKRKVKKLKDKFTSVHILASFDPEKKIILDTDAFD